MRPVGNGPTICSDDMEELKLPENPSARKKCQTILRVLGLKKTLTSREDVKRYFGDLLESVIYKENESSIINHLKFKTSEAAARFEGRTLVLGGSTVTLKEDEFPYLPPTENIKSQTFLKLSGLKNALTSTGDVLRYFGESLDSVIFNEHEKVKVVDKVKFKTSEAAAKFEGRRLAIGGSTVTLVKVGVKVEEQQSSRNWYSPVTKRNRGEGSQ